jgi:hypothetical protein
LLDRVEFTTKNGNTLVIPMYDGADGYFFDSVDGLDPVKATLVSSSSANVDGEQYQSSRREPRNLVFKMGVDVSQIFGSVSQLRRKMMGLLMPKAEVTLRFFSDDFPAVDIVGIVESFDWPLFVEEPEVTLTILCHKPDFIDLTTATVASQTTPGSVETVVDYEGSIETGFKFRMTVNRALSGFTILHRSPTDILSSFEFEEALVAGDLLEISTVTGSKEVMLTRAGTKSSILYAMAPYSNWINLFPGANRISVVAEGAGIGYSIEYINRYGGL